MALKNLGNSIKNMAEGIGKAAANETKKAAQSLSKSVEEMDTAKLGELKDNALKGAQELAEKTSTIVKTGTSKTTEFANKIMDVNGDGQIDIEDIIIMGLRIPGISVNREQFLRSEFMKDFSQEVIETAIACNPAQAGITTEEIEKYANEVIKFERNCVSGISAALSTPGGIAMTATIPADIAQYYGYMLRVAQKLLYLYGFPEIDTTEKGKKFDTETLNILTLCLGVMYGVAGANNALKSIAKALGTGVQKQLMKKALTKGTIYPIVKSISKWFGVRMTKEVFTGFFKHAIPVIGGVIGGGLTYVSFKPCCDKLKESLQNTRLSNPDYVDTDDEEILISDTADVDKTSEYLKIKKKIDE